MLTLELPIPLTSLQRIEQRILRDLRDAVEEWGEKVAELTAWEDSHILDNPTAEKLAAHKQTVVMLLRVGKFLNLGASHPDFPEKRLGERLTATLSILETKLTLWHGPAMSVEESDRILKSCGLI